MIGCAKRDRRGNRTCSGVSDRRGGRADAGDSDRSRPVPTEAITPSRYRDAIARICRIPGKPGLRYRARCAGKRRTLPHRSSPVPLWIEAKRKDARGLHGIEPGVTCDGGGFFPARRNGNERTHLSRIRKGGTLAYRADAAEGRASSGNRARLPRGFSCPDRSRLPLAGRVPPSKGNGPRPIREGRRGNENNLISRKYR